MIGQAGKLASHSMNPTLTTSPDGLSVIKHFEALYLRAYQCEAGVWTIGWGHTGIIHNDGTVFEGRVITEAEAEELLKHDLAKFEARVKRLVTVELKPCEFDALVSFDFNTGGLEKSTLLKKLNLGDLIGAAAEFPKWNKCQGRELRGLTRRRTIERALFLGVFKKGEFGE